MKVLEKFPEGHNKNNGCHLARDALSDIGSKIQCVVTPYKVQPRYYLAE